LEGFFESALCKSKGSCYKCRTSEGYRKGIIASFDDMEDINFECPYGQTKDNVEAPKKPEPVKMNRAQASKKDESPKAVTKAKNFSKAMFKFAWQLSEGGKTVVSDEVLNERIAICESNKCGKFNGKRMVCAQCGCPFKKKLVLSTEKCPLNYWKEAT